MFPSQGIEKGEYTLYNTYARVTFWNQIRYTGIRVFLQRNYTFARVALDLSLMELTVLVALLTRYGRLILPDLGAFLVTDFESGFRAANVTFSPFLRYNDGKFEQYLEAHYAQTRAQARQSVQHLVSEIRQALDESGHCRIPDLGELRRDAEGQLTFVPQDSPYVATPQAPVPDEPLAFDIPLIDEVVAPTLPEGEYVISDGNFGATSTPESPLPEPLHDEETFSLDGAIAEVNQHTASATVSSPLEIRLVADEPAHGDDPLVVLEPSASESGFRVDECLNALNAYHQSATVPPPPEHIEEETSPAEPEPTISVEPTPSEESTPTVIETPATKAAPEKEAPSPIQAVMSGVKPSRQARPTAASSDTTETPWVESHAFVKRERSYKGLMWTAIVLVLLSLVVIDWLWLQQVTPRFVALLEQQGILLRKHPSVEVTPQDAPKLAAVSSQASPHVSPPDPNTTVGELEKEWQRRVANGEGTAAPATNPPSPPVNRYKATTVDASDSPLPLTTASAFHVVLGCFRDVENADAYASKLKRSGFQTRVLDQASGMHAVVVGSYTTRREAALALNNIRARYPEAWVLEK